MWFPGILIQTSVAVLVVAFIAMACQPEKTDINEIRTVVEKANNILSEAIVDGDFAPLAEFYSESAVSMPPNSAPLMGRKAIISFFTDSVRSGMTVTSAQFSALDVDADGALAYERGSYTLTAKIAEVGLITEDGKYLTVWKLETDGRWRIQTDIWNSDYASPVPADNVSAQEH